MSLSSMRALRLGTAAVALPLLAGCSIIAPPREERVTIIRDEYGTPNIFAETAEGACFGAGYAQAEDRLEELLRQYRRATGTMAEIFGPEHYRDDYIARVWRHAEVSRKRYSEISERGRKLLEAYFAGVRQYMETHPERVPDWAPKLEPWMAVALGRYIIWGWPLGDAMRDLRNAGIELDPIEPRASNEWLVAPQRTAVGAVIALIDPHLSWYGPFRFYEERLYGGELAVAGVTILGTPIPSLGHSRYASVAMTTGGPDAADVYELTLHPEDKSRYLYDGEWRPLRRRVETIRVKEEGGVREVKVTIEESHHGPIVAHRGGKAYAMKIPYAEEVGLLDQIYAMMTARNLEEMRRALSQLQLMEQNIMVGTVQGDVYYVRNGRVPIRPPGFDWTRPVPGDTSKTEWLGIHPLEDLVQITNPPQGYMQNCNVSPAVMMVGSPLTPERWADRPYLYDAEHPYLHQRAAQTRAELHAATRLTVEEAIAIAHSVRVFNADVWQDRLRAAGGLEGLSEDARSLREAILHWNRESERTSTGATAYLYWKEEVYKTADPAPEAPGLPPARTLGELALLSDRAGVTPPSLPAERLLQALERAAKRLRAEWGRLDVAYGEIHRIGREGSPRHFPIGGGNLPGMSTPRAVSYKPFGERRKIGAGGQTATQVVVLTDPPRSYSLLPLGESDDPRSPHFDDQAEKLMQYRKLKPTYFLDREELLRHAESQTELVYRRGDAE